MAGNYGGYGNTGAHMAPMDPRGLFTHKGPNNPVPPGTTAGPTIDRGSFDVRVIQQPEDALVTVAGKEKSRKPIDPPPMYQIELYKGVDPQKHFYRNPYVFGTVTLIYEDKDEPYRHNGQDPLTGTLVSSLHCLKNHENKEGGFFIFGDISVKVVGRFRLRFSIHEVVPDDCAWYLGGAISEPFDVSLPKDYRGLKESTYLSRAFSDQGVRLRLRKDTRGGAGMKRPPPDDEGQNDMDAKRQRKSPSFTHSLSTIPVPAPRLSNPVSYYQNFAPMTARLPSSVPPPQPYGMYTMAHSQNSYINPGIGQSLPYMPNSAARYPSNNMPSQAPPNTNPQSSPNASSHGPTNPNPYSSSNMPNDNWPNNMGGDGSGYPWPS